MSDDSAKCNAATPSGDLLRDLMDPNIPKSEREWFARSYIQEMVKKAAENRLDGYRELGQRAADAENERDAKDATIAALTRERDEVREKQDKLKQALRSSMNELLKDAVSPEVQDYFDYVKQLRDENAELRGRIERAMAGLDAIVSIVESTDCHYAGPIIKREVNIIKMQILKGEKKEET